jgi:hypothetical protein
MAVAHVQTVKRVIDATASATHSSGAVTFTAGNLGICAVLSYAGGTAPPAVSSAVSSTGGSFTIDKTVADSVVRVTILSKANMSAGSQTCDITFADGTTDYVTIFFMEASGVATSSPADGTGAADQGTGTASSTGTFTGVATSFYVCATLSLATGESNTITAGAGWTIPTNGTEVNGSLHNSGGIEYKANPGGTSHAGEMTLSDAEWFTAAYAYLVATAATGIKNKIGMLGVG